MSAKITDAEHKLKGTRPTREAEHGADIPAGRPKYPKGISLDAKRVFKRLCALLETRRALTTGDGELLRLYAMLHTRHERAITHVDDEGEICIYTRLDSSGKAHDMEKPNLWLKVAQDSEKQMHAILRDLGLTPNARAKVKPVGDKPKPADPMEEFLNQNKPAQGSASLLEDLDDFDTEVTQ